MNPTVSGNHKSGESYRQVETMKAAKRSLYSLDKNETGKLQLFTMDMKYVRNLHNADDRVQSVSPQIHKSNRPFVGVVVICDKQKYCIPLDHPKSKHYEMNNDIDFTIIIVSGKLIGVLNFNNMVPVNDSVIQKLNVKILRNDSPADRAYKNLCAKELDWIQKKSGFYCAKS